MEDRKKLWELYTGEKPEHMRHPWLDYERYRYSNQIVNTLKERGVDFSKLWVVDYGAGVGDYGFDFGRNGAEVIFYDYEVYCNFIMFRWQNEKQTWKNESWVIQIDTGDIFTDMNFERAMKITASKRPMLAIFGEVLEHLENPLGIIEQFVDRGTEYIFTSSYPFRNDDPNDDYWRHPGHEHNLPRLQQPHIRELLFSKYERIQYNGEASLWVRKKEL